MVHYISTRIAILICGMNNNCHSWPVDCFVEAMDFLLIFKPEGLTKSITVMIITKY